MSPPPPAITQSQHDTQLTLATAVGTVPLSGCQDVPDLQRVESTQQNVRPEPMLGAAHAATVAGHMLQFLLEAVDYDDERALGVLAQVS